MAGTCDKWRHRTPPKSKLISNSRNLSLSTSFTEDCDQIACTTMYRSASKRLLLLPSRVRNGRPQISRVRMLTIPNSPRFSSTSASSSQAFSDQSPNIPHQSRAQNPNPSDSASSASSQSSGFAKESGPRHESQTSKGSRPQYQEEQAHVLSASLHHVVCTFTLCLISRFNLRIHTKTPISSTFFV